MPSDAEEDQYNEIFLILSSDGEGVTLDELTFFFQAMPNTPALSQIGEIFNQCDEDQSGAIDTEEFINVVETLKLLQNKTTVEILRSFKEAKFTSIFRLADIQRKGTLTKDVVTSLVAKLPYPSEVDVDNHIRGVLAPYGTLFSIDAFLSVVASLTEEMRTADVIETFMVALKDVADQRERQRFLTDIGQGGEGVSHSRPIEDDEGVGGCDGCVALRGRAMHLRLAVEAEKVVYRETKQQLDEAKERLEAADRMNRDLVFENEKVKKRIRELGAGASPTPNASFAAAEETLKKTITEKDTQIAAQQTEIETLKKSLNKQKQESGRQSAALALLHKHIAGLEKENEMLRKGGDRELVKEAMARQKLLTAKLEAAEKTIASFQQDKWYDDKLDYLSTQKSPLVSAAASSMGVSHGWQPESTPQRRQDSTTGFAKAAIRKGARLEDIAVDPTDDEYRVLSNYYHPYQNARTQAQRNDMLAACSDELDKVNRHHPAYWSGKDGIRIKSWMKRPAVSDGVLHKKKYVVSGVRSVSNGLRERSEEGLGETRSVGMSRAGSVASLYGAGGGGGGGGGGGSVADGPPIYTATATAASTERAHRTAHSRAIALAGGVTAKSVSPTRRPATSNAAAAAGGSVGGVSPPAPVAGQKRW